MSIHAWKRAFRCCIILARACDSHGRWPITLFRIIWIKILHWVRECFHLLCPMSMCVLCVILIHFRCVQWHIKRVNIMNWCTHITCQNAFKFLLSHSTQHTHRTHTRAHCSWVGEVFTLSLLLCRLPIPIIVHLFVWFCLIAGLLRPEKHDRHPLSDTRSDIIQYFVWPALVQKNRCVFKAVVATWALVFFLAGTIVHNFLLLLHK